MRLAYMIATLAGLGGRVVCPGTAGSLIGILPSLAALHLAGVRGLAAFLTILSLIAYWAVDTELKVRFRSSPRLSAMPYDPQDVVIDEVIGQGIALMSAVSGWDVVLAFALFRIFDIAKPWPIWLLERRLTGAAGILADDFVAGGFALLVLMALHVVGSCAGWSF